MRPVTRVLVANRGEVAVRVIRACRDSGRTAIAVYADQDAGAEFVRLADEAWALEGTTPAQTYLDADRLVEIARLAAADAVHPGYGFLSESAGFARAVIEAGLTWVGPPPEVIELLGDKVAARRLAERVGAPLAPATDGPVSSAAEALAFAREHGLPVVIKAVHGGGGRGLRVAWRLDEVAEQYAAASREAVQAFGRGECFVERFLDRARHVEVQILADAHGTVVPVGTRDCSLQRRSQKLVEEAPAPGLTDEQHRRLTSAARDLCADAGYVGAGTVEFLLDADGTLSFLEVNTRLQVEHPVTEETTGLDLVREQLDIAAGGRIDPEPPAPHGHAIEFRINAEDPARGFLPVPGVVTSFRLPGGPGVRIDSGVAAGSVVSGAFDSLLAKVVVWGPTRADALRRARRALGELEVDGVPTVAGFARDLLDHSDFADADGPRIHTRWVETVYATRERPAPLPDPPADEAGMVRTWVEVNGQRLRLGLPASLLGALADAPRTAPAPAAPAKEASPVPEGAVVAPLTGSLVRWLLPEGASVQADARVAVIESMKMEVPVTAPRAGVLTRRADEGALLDAGAVLGVVATA